MRISRMDRRQVTRGLVAGVAAASTLTIRLPYRDGPAGRSRRRRACWRDLADLTRAQELGLSVPRMSFAASGAEESYDEIMPAVIDFMDSVSTLRRTHARCRPLRSMPYSIAHRNC